MANSLIARSSSIINCSSLLRYLPPYRLLLLHPILKLLVFSLLAVPRRWALPLRSSERTTNLSTFPTVKGRTRASKTFFFIFTSPTKNGHFFSDRYCFRGSVLLCLSIRPTFQLSWKELHWLGRGKMPLDNVIWDCGARRVSFLMTILNSICNTSRLTRLHSS